MRTALIVNPAAGHRKPLRLLPKLMAWSQKQGIEFKILSTTGPGDATRLARMAMLDGFERLVVLGGDGTLNEVAQAAAGTNTIVGVLPGGSGNDFYKMLGKNMPLTEAFETAFTAPPHEVDIGLANGRYFVNALGVGFDAKVAARAREYKLLSGVWIYLAAAFYVWRRFQPLSLEIELDNLKLNQKVTLVCIGNGRSAGGGFYLTPQAKFDDGLFDICIIEELPKIKIFKYLPRALNGTHIRLDGVRIYRSRRVVIKSAERFPVHIDGEIMTEPPDKLEIVLDKKKLKVAMFERTL